jgi:TIR domain
MPIKYSCFISYRSPSAELARDFHISLDRELRHWTPLPIYRDETRLNAGDFFNRELALALCESACMVMIYTPTYFDKFSTYCAREYKAMEIIESWRLEQLGYERNYQHGLIIPVVYRGADIFPAYVSGVRNYYKFDSFHAYGKSYLRNNQYQNLIRQIAKYIYERCNELNALDVDPCYVCGSFEIPLIEEIHEWLSPLLPPKPIFPGRKA